MLNDFPLEGSPIRMEMRGICENFLLACSVVYFTLGDASLNAFARMQYPCSRTALPTIIKASRPLQGLSWLAEQCAARAVTYSERERPVTREACTQFYTPGTVSQYCVVHTSVPGNK